MSAQAWANLIAGFAFLAALGALVRGELNARDNRQDAEKAQRAAEEANGAANRAATALERMAEQFAESLSRAEKRDQRQWVSRTPRGDGGPWAGLPSAGPSEPIVHWTVDKIRGGRHALTNLGRGAAHNVVLSSENAIRFDAPEPRDIQMGEAVEFIAVGSWQTGTPELVVTWSDTPECDGERRTWTRILP
ncbi:hypothetical protein GCM10009844_22580 [Nocardioides koreensis]|uniref:Uncharacterized protein n=1 Tax=Nocardioides koreensis TaxID=433651 RepID=A0ABN2ZRT2_9ACTN